MRRVVSIVAVTVLVHWVLAGTASADCSSQTGSFWDWDRCWSGTRLAITGVWVFVAGWGCATFVFPGLLAPHQDTAPWPREAFGLTLALYLLAIGAAVLALFAPYELVFVKKQPVFYFPAPIGFLNYHWKWLAVVVVDLAMVAWALTWFRHREPAKSPARSTSKKGKV